MTSTYRAALAGAAAGLAGSIAMNGVSKVWAAESGDARPPGSVSEQGARPDVAGAQQNPAAELATGKVAAAIEQPARGRPLSRMEQLEHGKAVHLMYGAALGAAYGLALRDTRSGPASDVAFGLLVWGAGILVALPALRLSRSPREYSAREHALGVVGHLVYGTALGSTYRLLNRTA